MLWFNFIFGLKSSFFSENKVITYLLTEASLNSSSYMRSNWIFNLS